LIRLYTLSEQDLSVIKQRRGDANRLGFAVLLCCLRYPGYALPAGEDPPHTFLTMISAQLGVEPEIWAEYAGREETRREHLSELRTLSIAESDFSNTLLENDGTLEVAQRIAGHADSRTTKLYDRRGQKVLLEDMERIRY
jgi:hypothetical protein